MIPYWPIDAGILLPVRRGLPARTLVSPMEDGPPKVRRRNRGSPGSMSGSVRMTGADFALFMIWGERTLLDWSLPFRWVDPVNATEVTLQFQGPPQPTMETSASGALSLASSGWSVSVDLWVLA